jgi:hypothetical protein
LQYSANFARYYGQAIGKRDGTAEVRLVTVRGSTKIFAVLIAPF